MPARLKFLKQPATEAAHIQQIVTRYALAYPERRFSLVSDGKLVFQSTGSGKLYDVLVKVYGLEMAREMLADAETKERRTDERIDESAIRSSAHSSISHSSIVVTGYIGAPSLHRGNRSYITLFVNRRWFQDTSIAYSVIQAYHTMLPVGRYPVAVIFIEIPPEEVDVNVHPTKAEVRFRDSGAVFSAVQKAVRRTLTDHAPIPQVGMGRAAAGSPSPDAVWLGSEASRPRRSAGRHGPSAAMRCWARAASSTVFSRHPGLGHRQPPSRPLLIRPRTAAFAAGRAAPASPLMPLLRVVGQLGATYIVAEGPDGMYLIDQHAAHERVLYEQMLAEHDGEPAGGPTAAGAAGARPHPGAGRGGRRGVGDAGRIWASRSSRSAARATWCAASRRSWAARTPTPR